MPLSSSQPFDTATGTLLTGSCDPEAWSMKNQGLPGGELAVFRDRFVMYGGKPFFSDHSERTGTEAFEGQLRYGIFSFLELGTQGQPLADWLLRLEAQRYAPSPPAPLPSLQREFNRLPWPA